RLDPPDDHEQIVLAGQREDRVDQIVPRALVTQVDFQPVSEEGEEVNISCRYALAAPWSEDFGEDGVGSNQSLPVASRNSERRFRAGMRQANTRRGKCRH